MKKSLIAMILCCAVIASVGCGSTTANSDFKKAKIKNPYEKAAYFLDRTYESDGKKNTMVSPLSLDMALGLVSGGAKGKTAKELNDYLAKEDYGSFAAEYMQYAETLNHDLPEKVVFIGEYASAFKIANSVWIDDERKIVSEYKEKAENDFQAEIATVNFHDKLNAVKTINDWCDQKTRGLIPNAISEGVLEESPAMLLVNSLYFEAPWVEKWTVLPGTFTDIDGKETTQDMLGYALLGCYYENKKAIGFSKAYGNGIEFIGILPKKTGDFEVQDLELASFLDSLNMNWEVHAMMPKLKFETTADQIVSILKAQGMEAPFDSRKADFSGLVGTESDDRTYISDIIQKCRIELDENGTKAAATTSMIDDVALAAKLPVVEVYLNRPFAFMIYDREYDQILFIGKVVNLDF